MQINMDAIQKFNQLGFKFEEPKLGQVTMPADITELTSDQLAVKFTALTAWADYIASKLTLAILEERQAQKLLDFEESKLLVTRMGASVRGERVTTVKAQINIDENIQALSQDYEDKYAYRKMLEMLFTNHERDISLISREITRRSNENRFTRKEF
jgi:hypothetical protein